MKAALAIIIAIVVLCVSISIVSNFAVFVEFLALVITIVAPTLIALVVYSPAVFGKAWACAFGANGTQEEYQNSAAVFRFMRYLALAWGFIAILIGAIALLATLEGLSQIGPKVALALLSAFYALVYGFAVCYPLESIIKQKTPAE